MHPCRTTAAGYPGFAAGQDGIPNQTRVPIETDPGLVAEVVIVVLYGPLEGRRPDRRLDDGDVDQGAIVDDRTARTRLPVDFGEQRVGQLTPFQRPPEPPDR